ncbi:hypothetical protein JAAARDRAFT_153904 [Jaapia argillacea MUCL 33604]|uniref:Post-GPI attachment to proteins factor 3 n=1 Tax=Jaapia argillacea MUCL 33604 TaxID=933084 RepID=A0A067Q8I0_9AGAM|nr:hypothetical protein JAAARDRAFT_153904 [Jaapia argillacea MUCL 33604]
MKLVLILLLSLCLLLVSASSGDRSPAFQSCLLKCDYRTCKSLSSTWSPSLALRLTRWTCTDDCKYTCMHEITSRALSSRNGEEVQQYYGKWPFWRLGGAQEPASVVFSLANLYMHLRGIRAVRRSVPEDHPLKTVYLWWGWVNVNAWIWSAVFHTRDLPWTEKMDYFSAAVAIMYGLYSTVVRFTHIYPPPPSSLTLSSRQPSSHWKKNLYRLWSTLCTLIIVAHITYLTSLPRFDYAYNITFNLVLGLSHNFLWLIFSLPASITSLFALKRYPHAPISYRPTFASKAAWFVVLTTLATTLELFDFAPWWRIIDAHSLWHAATVPIVGMWYDFLVQDSRDEGWRYGGWRDELKD